MTTNTNLNMNKRQFIRVLGGGVVFSALGTQMSGCMPTSAFPAQAVEAWSTAADQTDPRRRAVAYAITAPNPHNRQPWMVDLREADTITLYHDVARMLPETDPFGRQILIGHGCFIELLCIALAEQGLAADVSLWPQGQYPAQIKDWDRRPIARISLRKGVQPDPLFAHILNRHTPKAVFDTTRPVADSLLQSLLKTTASTANAGISIGGITIGGTLATDKVSALGDLCRQAAFVELSTERTMMESMRLMRVGPGEILQHRDGISLNKPLIRALEAVGQFDRSKAPAPGSAAFKGSTDLYEGYTKSAMGFVWVAAGNQRDAQIQAGRQYVRLQLAATAQGLGMHPMSQSLQEFPEMRKHYEAVHQLCLGKAAPAGLQDTTLQMLCRIGYTPEPAPATPRRPLVQFFMV